MASAPGVFSPSTIIFSVLWSPVCLAHLKGKSDRCWFWKLFRSADVALLEVEEVAKIINPKLWRNVATCTRGKRFRPASLELRSRVPMKRCPLFYRLLPPISRCLNFYFVQFLLKILSGWGSQNLNRKGGRISPRCGISINGCLSLACVSR